MMRNNKAIVINGFARGGTNILWNIMQSHPNICSPVFEINEIIGARSGLPGIIRIMLSNPSCNRLPGLSYMVQMRLEKFKRKNAIHPENRYKSENVKYTIQEIEQSTICLKGVYSPGLFDIRFSELFDFIYRQAYHITIIREGFSLCEGWLRRGIEPEITGKLYTSFMKIVETDKERFSHYAIVDFDKLLKQPFELADKLFRFCNEPPCFLGKIRLKVKRTTGIDNRHEARYGQENKKYWFNKDTITQIINPSISFMQAGKITADHENRFYKHAAEGIAIYKTLRDNL